MLLYHYYERQSGPLRTLSDLPLQDAQSILSALKSRNDTFAARRDDGYLQRRRQLEQTVRDLFIAKGGTPLRQTPHYFVVEPCPWLETWFVDTAHIKLPAAALDPSLLSFTYGDMFPTFSPRVQDGKAYRNTVYTYAEILDIIDAYGLPQIWNPHGAHGPERYIEAQVWTDPSPDIFLP